MVRSKVGPILLHTLLMLVVLIILLPMLYTFLTSLKNFRDIVTGAFPFELTLANYQELFTGNRSNFSRLTLNSLLNPSQPGIGSIFVLVTIPPAV